MNFANNLAAKFFVILMTVTITSCVTRLPTPEGVREISLSDYERMVSTKTLDERVYHGFTNQLEIFVTRLDSEMTEALLSHSARLYQWPSSQYNDERNKAVLKQATQSEFALSFFTPERKNDDLSRTPSVWRIYLEVDGIRYEGKATKDKRALTELQTLYPHHNRWFTPYVVTFPVASTLIDKKAVNFVLTGPAGSAQLLFRQ